MKIVVVLTLAAKQKYIRKNKLQHQHQRVFVISARHQNHIKLNRLVNSMNAKPIFSTLPNSFGARSFIHHQFEQPRSTVFTIYPLKTNEDITIRMPFMHGRSMQEIRTCAKKNVRAHTDRPCLSMIS